MWHRRVDNSSIFATLTDENPELSQPQEQKPSSSSSSSYYHGSSYSSSSHHGSSYGAGAASSVPVDVSLENLREWEDFSHQRVTSAVGRILSARFDNPVETVLEPRHLRASAVDDAFDLWNGYIVNFLFHALTPHIEDSLGRDALAGFFLGKKPFAISKHPKAAETKISNDTFPDWGVATATSKLIIGYTVNDPMWSSDMMLSGGPEAVAVVKRLANACVRCRTRYGCVLAAGELVVFRFYSVRRARAQTRRRKKTTTPTPATPTPTQEIVGAHWRKIPWSTSGRTQLTMNLALFALVLMSLHEETRQIDALDATVADGDAMWRWLGDLCRRARAHYNFLYGFYQSATTPSADHLVFSPTKHGFGPVAKLGAKKGDDDKQDGDGAGDEGDNPAKRKRESVGILEYEEQYEGREDDEDDESELRARGRKRRRLSYK